MPEKMKNKLDSIKTAFNKMMAKDLIFILVMILVTRILLFFVADVAYTWMIHNPEDIAPAHASDNKFIEMWYQWDAKIYYKMINEGYSFSEVDGKYAFFPLLPLIMKFLSLITGDVLITGIIFINICLYFTLIILQKLIRLKFDEDISRKAIIFLLIFPCTLFFSILMTESLFLLLLVSAFYALMTNKTWLAGIFGALLSATRSVGILFMVAGIFYLIRTKKHKEIFWMLLCPIGLLLFMAYLNNVAGNPFAFATAQQAFGRDISLGSFNHLTLLIKSFLNFRLGNFINILFFIFALSSIIWCWFFWEKSIAVFSILAILMPVSTASLISLNRYAMVILPIYLFLAYLSKNKEIERILLISSAALMSLWVIIFVSGYFIA
jgi:Gpi18-like mannosyltransferase